jgi:hypothetical protein
MKQHWPIAVAVILIVLAVSAGTWQHDQAVIAASVSVTSGSPSPTPDNGVQPAAKPPVSPAAPAAPALPNAAPPVNVTPPAPVVPAATVPVAAPAAPAVNPATLIKINPPAPGAAAAPAANPAAPAAVPADGIVPRKAGRTATLNEIRAMVQGKLGAQPTDLAAGGYALSVEGVRIEVQPPPAWSVSIYNNNPKAPQEETSNFKACLETVVAGLAADMTQKPVESANGKTYMKTTCKLGSISIVRDPATGNSCTIRPLGPQTLPAAPSAPAVLPQKPKAPDGPPVAPPRPPATDANF